MTPLVIAGVRDRYALAVAVVLVALLVLLVLFQRRRRPGLELHQLETADAQRYADEFTSIETDFVAHPEQAAARARGIVEEVMRRMGFPDRIETKQRVRDVAGHDRQAAVALEAADRDLRGSGDDTERLRRAIQAYRQVLDRLLDLPRAG